MQGLLQLKKSSVKSTANTYKGVGYPYKKSFVETLHEYFFEKDGYSQAFCVCRYAQY